MELAHSWSAFFYNIIPGFIFLFFNSFYFASIQQRIFTRGDAMSVLQVVVISIFLGFVFQSLTKKFRDFCLDQKIIDRVEIEDEQVLGTAIKLLGKISGTSKESTIKKIYAMHNFLVAKYKMILPEFFAPRLALWSNILFATILTIILILIATLAGTTPEPLSGNIVIDIGLLALFSWHSYTISEKYLFALFDSIIRTFITVRYLGKKSVD